MDACSDNSTPAPRDSDVVTAPTASLCQGGPQPRPLTVLTRGQIGRSYNIGGENEATNIDLVRGICAHMDRLRPNGAPHADLITFVPDRPGHDRRYAIDPTRIREELGWRPSVTVEEGLRRTVEWYLENEDWWRPLLDRDGVGKRLGTG